MATGIVTSLVTGGASKLLEGVANFVNLIRGKDPVAAAAIERAMIDHAHELSLADNQLEQKYIEANVRAAELQAQVNVAEAQSADKFTSRWRPFIGWICGFALAFQFIARPLLTWTANVIAVNRHLTPEMAALIAVPQLDMGDLLTLLLGMLGLGGMRSYEKVKGKA